MCQHLARLQHFSKHIQIIGPYRIGKIGCNISLLFFSSLLFHRLYRFTCIRGSRRIHGYAEIVPEYWITHLSRVQTEHIQLPKQFWDTILNEMEIVGAIEWKHVSTDRHNCNLSFSTSPMRIDKRIVPFHTSRQYTYTKWTGLFCIRFGGDEWILVKSDTLHFKLYISIGKTYFRDIITC